MPLQANALPTKEDLLAHQRLDIALTAADALSAAIEGTWLITSPNCSSIPQPQWGLRRVRLRDDCRYGFDDFTLWPQAYVHEFRHLAAIPKKPLNSNDPLAFMWWNMTTSDFIEDVDGPISGLGQLTPTRLDELNGFRTRIATRFHNLISNSESLSPKAWPLFKALNHSAARLGAFPATFQETKFGVTEFQRLYLELHGLLDFLEVYVPRIEGPPSVDRPDTGRCIGAFTSDARVAEEFYDAGLPVYLIRQLSHIGGTWPNIQTFVSATIPDHLISLGDASPPFPTIFEGYTNTNAKHIAVHSFSRSRMVHKDPFGEAVPVNVAAASTTSHVPNCSETVDMSDLLSRRVEPARSSAQQTPPPSRSSFQDNSGGKRSRKDTQTHNKPSKRAKKGNVDPASASREDVSSPLLPPNIPAWAEALEAVISSRPSGHHRSTQYRQHVLPKPQMFVTPQTNEKKVIYLRTWVQARPALKYALQKSCLKPVSTQTWRTFLDYARLNNNSNDLTTQAAAHRHSVEDVFGKLLQNSAMSLSRLGGTSKVSWRGHELVPGQLPPTTVIHEILWELSELNFRTELFSLDKTLSRLSMSDNEREEALLKCFPGDPSFLLDVKKSATRNLGLAASTVRERRPYLTALAKVLRHWPECPGIADGVLQSGPSTSDTLYENLEDNLAKFYIQSSFDQFGRAPILPVRYL